MRQARVIRMTGAFKQVQHPGQQPRPQGQQQGRYGHVVWCGVPQVYMVSRDAKDGQEAANRIRAEVSSTRCPAPHPLALGICRAWCKLAPWCRHAVCVCVCVCAGWQECTFGGAGV